MGEKKVMRKEGEGVIWGKEGLYENKRGRKG